MIKKYKKILLALELSDDCDTHLIKKAVEVAETFGAKVTLIHAVEYLSNYGAAYGVSAGVDIEEELKQEAVKMMAKVGKKLDIPQESQIIKVGPARHIILDEAENLKTDLIIVGSHGRSGVRLLLGSTANAILHGAKCDVLAVRVKE